VSPLLATEFRESNGELSPDGRWLAYDSTETGQSEVFVRPFPEVGAGRWRVSPNGGGVPLWARSGRELFYLAPDGSVMGVPVHAARGQFATGPPTKVIDGSAARNVLDGSAGRYVLFSWRAFDVTPDGSRFLMMKEADPSEEERGLVVVQHWVEELKRLLPLE
jgi:serine/threonine-protein kinase